MHPQYTPPCNLSICQQCGATVHSKPSRPKKYCSRLCTNLARRQPLAKRFWQKVDKSGDCWLWTARTSRFGYGRITCNGEAMPAHRIAYELTHGPITDGLWVLHRCDNPRCVNPAHLFLGTSDDNLQDRNNKGRQARGERNSHAVLTSDDVVVIRNRFAAGDVTKSALAREYGVTPGTILAIVNRINWRHI